MYPEDVIITIDDDVEYPDTFIEDCIRSYKLYPNAINAGRVHRIKWDDSVLYPYKEWEWEWDVKDSNPSFDLFFTGVGGVVYPENFFKKEDLDINEIKQYILVDDVFLNNLCRKRGFQIKKMDLQKNYTDISVLPFKTRLCSVNVLFNNNLCLKKIKFHETLKNCNKYGI